MTSEFMQGGLEIYRDALTQATEEELRELILERLRIPDGIESEKKEHYERMIEEMLSLPKDSLISLLVSEEALY